MRLPTISKKWYYIIAAIICVTPALIVIATSEMKLKTYISPTYCNITRINSCTKLVNQDFLYICNLTVDCPDTQQRGTTNIELKTFPQLGDTVYLENDKNDISATKAIESIVGILSIPVMMVLLYASTIIFKDSCIQTAPSKYVELENA